MGSLSEQHFLDARRKAWLAQVSAFLRGQPIKMLSFEEVRARLNVRGQRYLGFQVIELDLIVGSEGRYDDFDRWFQPRSDNLRIRWSRVDQAMHSDIHLPPIDVYKLGGIYFVRDGNHRVSVARQLGASYIDAYVTELLVDIPLGPDLTVRDLLLKEEYSDFLEWTNLHDLRPDERIEFSELGGYLNLVRHINAHRHYMGIETEGPVDRDVAVADWYDKVYMPIINVIREQDMLKHFPGRTEADLYVWIMDHRWYMRERLGNDPGPEVAATEYVKTFGQKGLTSTLENAIKSAWNVFQQRDT